MPLVSIRRSHPEDAPAITRVVNAAFEVERFFVDGDRTSVEDPSSDAPVAAYRSSIAAAVGGKVPVLLDSGIRSGGDIVKAMALGAKAVLTGRPIAWGVGAFGASGVERVFHIFAEEMQRVLVMTGVGRARDVTKDILIRDEWGKVR